MRLAEKFEKLTSSKGLKSALRNSREALLRRRPGLRLDVATLVATIDAPRFNEIRQRHVIENPGQAWPKYLNLPLWMKENLRRVRELKLELGFRKRILDLGCGAGYFLHICQLLGHDAIGLDINEVSMFAEMMMMLGLTRVIWRIEPFVPLPQFERKFDLITAFMICFNGHKTPELWGPKEWTYFLDDLGTRLRPGGRICLGFNHEEDGSFYSEELRELFTSRGAEINGKRVLLKPGRPFKPAR